MSVCATSWDKNTPQRSETPQEAQFLIFFFFSLPKLRFRESEHHCGLTRLLRNHPPTNVQSLISDARNVKCTYNPRCQQSENCYCSNDCNPAGEGGGGARRGQVRRGKRNQSVLVIEVWCFYVGSRCSLGTSSFSDSCCFYGFYTTSLPPPQTSHNHAMMSFTASFTGAKHIPTIKSRL